MSTKINYLDIPSLYKFDSGISGPNITIFSGVHGDEVSGIKATSEFIDLLKSGEIKLLKGNLIIVSECNKEAIQIGKREVNKNLNRLFKDDFVHDMSDYEESRAFELMQILKNTDYLLDLHSTPGPSIPFMFAETQNMEIASQLGVSHILSGWSNLGGVVAGDTENYVNKYGGMGFTFEAGDHLSPEGEKNAYQCILNFLSVLGIIDKKYFKQIGQEKLFLNMKGVYVAKNDNFNYEIDITNFQKIKKGNLIGYDGNIPVISQENMVFVMPKTSDIIKKGIEVFFIGEEI